MRVHRPHDILFDHLHVCCLVQRGAGQREHIPIPVYLRNDAARKGIGFFQNGSLLLAAGVRDQPLTTDSPERTASIRNYKPTVCVFDVPNRRLLAAMDGHTSDISAGSIAPNGREVVTASSDHTVRVWDLNSRQQTVSIPTGDITTEAVVFSPDSRSLFFGQDNNVLLADASTGRVYRTMLRSGGAAAAITLSPDKIHLLVNSGESGGRFWDLHSGDTVPVKDAPAELEVAIFSADGKYVLAGFRDHSIGLWDPVSGNRVAALGTLSASPTSVRFHPNGTAAIVGCDDGSVRVVDFRQAAETNNIQLTLPGQKRLNFGSMPIANPPRVHVSPDGALAAAWRSNWAMAEAEQPQIWELANVHQRCTFTGHTGRVVDIRFAPDSRSATTVSMDGVVRTWSTQTCQQIMAINTGEVDSSSVVSDDGRLMAVGTLDGV